MDLNEFLKKSKKKKRAKYGSKKKEVDGIKFDSAKEAARYGQLKMMKRANLISNLRMQVSYKLLVKRWEVNGQMYDVGLGQAYMRAYIADFVYFENGKEIIEDVKSVYTRRMRPYRIKKDLMKKVYGIDIKET